MKNLTKCIEAYFFNKCMYSRNIQRDIEKEISLKFYDSIKKNAFLIVLTLQNVSKRTFLIHTCRRERERERERERDYFIFI
jgi:hypothetical protein